MSKFGAVFLLLLVAAVLNASILRTRTRSAATTGSRVSANERLTAINGALLFALLVPLAITILFIRPMLSVHYLVGFALIPPLALKLYSTGYRFLRYYAHDVDFMQAGPPPLLLRFGVAPILVASSVAVMASGLELWAFAGRLGTWWLTVHTLSAVVFIISVFVHLLSHLRRSSAAVAEEASAQPSEGVMDPRSILLACTILAVVIAAASLTYTSPFGSSFGGG